MKIATYNCNGVRARIKNITDWLTANDPDILCMQEIKVDTGLFPHEPLSHGDNGKYEPLSRLGM